MRRRAGKRYLARRTQLFTEAPKCVTCKHAKRFRTIRQAVKITANIMTTAVPIATSESCRRPAGDQHPTVPPQRGPELFYAPDAMAGPIPNRVDLGDYEQDPTRGKDRPVLSSWAAFLLGCWCPARVCCRPGLGGNPGSSAWDYEGRESWVRLDRGARRT